jgi:SAM-dependent methyltransferase
MTGEVDGYLEANRRNWNERAAIHRKDETGFYGIETLLAGGNLLTPIERAEIGDITGLRIAHFQCHIGTDTLSLKRLGAAEIVGLDFSDAAIAHARALSHDTGLAAEFVTGSVFDAPALIGGGFDMVFTSWGTLCWLPDLGAWARAIAGVLKPGGRLYFADSHPLLALYEDDGEGGIAPQYDYGTARNAPQSFTGELTYTGSQEKLANSQTYEWMHSISHVLNALIGADLRIDAVNEHHALPWQMFSIMVPGEDRLYRLPPGHVRLPLAWSVVAHKD